MEIMKSIYNLLFFLLYFFGIFSSSAQSLDICDRPYDPSDMAVMGDSQVQGIGMNYHLKNGLAIKGISGKKVSSALEATLISEYDSAIHFMGKKLIYIQMGGNDLSAGGKAYKIYYDLMELVKLVKIKTGNADTRIVVGTVPVRGQWIDKDSGVRAKIEKELNELNQLILKESSWVSVDIHPFIQDQDEPRLLSSECLKEKPVADWDMVHLSNTCYRLWGELIFDSCFR